MKTGSVDKKICRKNQGKAEDGNTCLLTPGTCESCPEWGRWKPTNRERLDIYDRLREAHKHIQAIQARFKTLNGFEENAIDAVDSVLYLAEGVFAEQK